MEFCTMENRVLASEVDGFTQTKKSLEKVLTKGGIKWYTTKAVAKSGDKAITKASAKAKKLFKKTFKKYLTNEKQPDIIVRLSREEYGL